MRKVPKSCFSMRNAPPRSSTSLPITTENIADLFLAITQIQHRRTEVRSPQTNGFCEFFRVAFSKTLYDSGVQLQNDRITA
jgi:hypothetical protein